jgi:hypothetical protein
MPFSEAFMVWQRSSSRVISSARRNWAKGHASVAVFSMAASAAVSYGDLTSSSTHRARAAARMAIGLPVLIW